MQLWSITYVVTKADPLVIEDHVLDTVWFVQGGGGGARLVRGASKANLLIIYTIIPHKYACLSKLANFRSQFSNKVEREDGGMGREVGLWEGRGGKGRGGEGRGGEGRGGEGRGGEGRGGEGRGGEGRDDCYTYSNRYVQ